MKILTIVGARPQFVKASAVGAALSGAGIEEICLHTGQHYDANLSEIFFQELGLRRPDIHLGVGSGSHAEQTAAMLVGIEKALILYRPDWMLVYGDTNSTLSGALAASKLQVPLAHVEAGLRSFNLAMPEEINRIVADRLSQLLFTPTTTASENLFREGVAPSRVQMVGDVMFDVILKHRESARRVQSPIDTLGLGPKGFILATIHRAENTDNANRLAAIFEGLAMVARTLPVVIPLHPRTRKALQALNLSLPPDLHIIEPQGFIGMQRLEMDAIVIVTDSGGVQKEAFWHEVPCVTLRDETEWVELVQEGANVLCPPVDAAEICQTVLGARKRVVRTSQLYGDGQAAIRIAAILAGGNGRGDYSRP